MSETKKINVAIVGASGYTGADCVRLLVNHPHVIIRALTGERYAGQRYADVYPHFRPYTLPDVVKVDSVDWDQIDVAFCCLPHGASQDIIVHIPGDVVKIDLSADFRLTHIGEYEEWYGRVHTAADLLSERAYGLSEHNREYIKTASLIACPGCYPTATLLALLPLLKAGAIQAEDIIIDAKSGVSGAGRSLKPHLMYCETAEGAQAYSVGYHRHMPEIEQELSLAIGDVPVTVNFTPHLVPMNRGELVTCHVKLQDGKSIQTLRNVMSGVYDQEYFVHLLPEGQSPSTRHVRGSNHCHINIFADRIPGRAIIIAAIDNLVKGSSGQAVQNFNIRFGFDEETGLQQAPLMP